MNYRALFVLIWAFLIGAAASAGEERQTRIEVAVDDDVAGEQSFVFDSEDAGFDLHGMAVGETRSVTDASGNTADVRRTVDGFEFDVSGQTISVDDIPAVDFDTMAHGTHEIEMHVDHADSNVEAVRKIKVIKTGKAEGVTIISAREIDAATRARIQEALEAGGYSGESLFMDGSELDGDGDNVADRKHQIRVIRKEVDVTD